MLQRNTRSRASTHTVFRNEHMSKCTKVAKVCSWTHHLKACISVSNESQVLGLLPSSGRIQVFIFRRFVFLLAIILEILSVCGRSHHWNVRRLHFSDFWPIQPFEEFVIHDSFYCEPRSLITQQPRDQFDWLIFVYMCEEGRHKKSKPFN